MDNDKIKIKIKIKELEDKLEYFLLPKQTNLATKIQQSNMCTESDIINKEYIFGDFEEPIK